MNFMEAVEAMKEGKKIRRKSWNEGHFWKLEEDKPELTNSQENIIDDWEIYEEDNWNLAKRVIVLPDDNSLHDVLKTLQILKISDVKTFIQKVLRDIAKRKTTNILEVNDIISKRAGDLK